MMTFILRLALAGTLAFSAAAFGGPEHDHDKASQYASRQGNGPGEDPARSFVGRLVRAVHTLDLDEAQIAAIHDILAENKEALHANHLATKDAHEALRETLMADSLDPTELEAIARLEGDLTAERIVLSAHVATRVLAELTEEQREELRILHEHHQRKMAQRKGPRDRS